MTNAMIILNESVKLMEAGIIKGSGIFGTVEDKEGNKKEIELPEEIHTYASWKSLGYQVQKGQKAKAEIVIWKHVTKKSKEKNEEDTEKMFMKKSYFFTKDQCKEIA